MKWVSGSQCRHIRKAKEKEKDSKSILNNLCDICLTSILALQSWFVN